MSDLNEINRSLGNIEGRVEGLTSAVERLTEVVEGLQKKSWTTKGLFAGIALAGGAAGNKLMALLGGLPPSQHP